MDTYTLEFKKSLLDAIDKDLEELDAQVTPLSEHINFEDTFPKDDT